MTINYNVAKVGSQLIFSSGNISHSGIFTITSGNFTSNLSISGVPISEIIDDEVASLLVSGSGITLSYNDSNNTLTIRTDTNTTNSTNLYLWSNFR